MKEQSKYVRFDWAIKRILRDKAYSEVLEGLKTLTACSMILSD